MTDCVAVMCVVIGVHCTADKSDGTQQPANVH